MPASPGFPFQPSTLLQEHFTPCFSSWQSTQLPGSPTMPCPPRPIPWSLYAELSHHLMSPQTRPTWPLLGPPPWCTSPPRSGPGPASWGLCCTRGGCGPEGRKQQAVRPCHQSVPSWCQLDERSFFTGSPDSFWKKVLLSQDRHMRSPNHPLPVGMGTLGHCPTPSHRKQAAHSQRAELPLPVAR